MIAAYVVGYSITPEYLAKNPHLNFVKEAKDIGVIISYNTEAPQVSGENPVVLPGAMAINSITWTWGEKTASAAENFGSVDMDENGKLTTSKKYADARVDKAKGVYHRYDYPFYYYNLRENAAVRTNRFLQDPKR